MSEISRQDIEEARKRIAPYTIRTPVRSSPAIDDVLGASISFKCENLQRCGVFKPRGATNAVFSLKEEEAARGVATHSSGNHAQALAYAARERGIIAHIVMPSSAPKIKVEGVRKFGGNITFCEPTLEARESTLASIVEETGAVFIHPYDNLAVITGQATCALELVEEKPDLDYIIGPVGGGGLMSGTCLSVGYWSPETKVLGAEPKGADDAFRSLRDGLIYPSVNPKTIADGLLTSLSQNTFSILSEGLSGILTVTEENILLAMKLIHENLGMIVEPSGAVSLASLLEGQADISGRSVGLIISGGNIEPERFISLVDTSKQNKK